jgi:hypothetical protein
VRVNDDDDVTFFDDEDTTDDAPESKFSQEDRNASKALCWLLNQTIVQDADGALNDKLSFDRIGGKFLPRGNDHKEDVGGEVSRDGNNIYIHYYKDRELKGFMEGIQLYRLSPHTDYFYHETTIVVTIDELQKAGAEGRVPDFEFEDLPSGRLHIEGYVGKDTERVPGSRPPPTFDEALALPSLMTDEEWERQQEVMKRAVRDQQVVRFGTTDDDRPVPYPFHRFLESNGAELTVAGQLIVRGDQPNDMCLLRCSMTWPAAKPRPWNSPS